MMNKDDKTPFNKEEIAALFRSIEALKAIVTDEYGSFVEYHHGTYEVITAG